MPHNPIRWTRVLFGVGVTLCVALAPMAYIVLTGPSPDGKTRAADQQLAAGLSSNGFNIADHQSAFFLIAGVAAFSLLAAVAVAARSLKTESHHAPS